MATYTVQRGDTLPGIARALLGDAGRWRELQLYNQGLLVDPAKLAAGMVLRLPPGAAIPAAPAAGLSRATKLKRRVARSARRPE